MKKCAYCEKEFNTPTNLKRHEITHTGEQPFKSRWCQICHKRFNRKGNMQVHYATHFKQEQTPKPFNCVCGKVYKTRGFYERHMSDCVKLKLAELVTLRETPDAPVFAFLAKYHRLMLTAQIKARKRGK